ncbi:MAG: T9SS type A sorting domain-containing protein [Bacteroidales bacterium]|jgi:hypothetical protein|nr:T9SS type A sorting domain-containing protein [Bacteroidales bacterium]
MNTKIKLKTIIVSLLMLILAMSSNFLSAQSTGSITNLSGGNGSQANPYLISNAQDLVDLSNFVLAADDDIHNCVGMYFKVTTDIDMKSIANFVPIGGRSKKNNTDDDDVARVFRGKFDGNNKVIKNLKITSSTNSNGLFGVVVTASNTTEIKNITLDSCKIVMNGVAGGHIALFSGALIGTMEAMPSSGCVVRNCHVTNSTIQVGSNAECIGGLIGSILVGNTIEGSNPNIIVDSCSVKYFYTLSSTTAADLFGGLIGEASCGVDITNCNVDHCVIDHGAGSIGGLIGRAEGGSAASYARKISNCHTFYNLIRGSGACVGGMIGNATSNLNIEDCSSSYDSVMGKGRTGGLIGKADTNVSIKRCYNTYSYVQDASNFGAGGLIGGAEAATVTIEDSYSSLSIVVGLNYAGGLIGDFNGGANSIKNCYAANKVIASGTGGNLTAYRGGLSGKIPSSTAVQNSYYISTWTSQSLSGQNTNATRGVSKTPDQMRDIAFVGTLNAGRTSNAVWFQDTALYVNGGYPILKYGRGQVGSTYQIWNVEDLRALSAMVQNGIPTAGSNFLLMADIIFPANDNSFIPIGGWADENTNDDAKAFSGNFAGNRFYISGADINKPNNDYVGLFGLVDGGRIEEVAFLKSNIAGKDYAGGLVGKLDSKAVVNRCFATGDVRGENYVGGLIGYIDGAATVAACYAKCVVEGIDYVGGFAGSAEKVYNSYCVPNVLCLSDASTNVGAFCGHSSNATSLFSQCYYNSNWTTQGGLTSNAYGTPKTKADMVNKAAFVTLLNTGIDYPAWRLDDSPWTRNGGYPILGYEPFVTDLCIIEDWQTIKVNTKTDYDNRPSTIIIEDGGSLVNNYTSGDFDNVTVEHKLYNEQYSFIGSAFGNITFGQYLGEDGSKTYQNIYGNYPASCLLFNYNSNMWWGDPDGYTYAGYNTNMDVANGYFTYILDPTYGTPSFHPSSVGKMVKQSANAGKLFNKDITFSLTNNGIEKTPESPNVDGLWYALSNPYSGNLYAADWLHANTNVQGNVIYTFNSVDSTWNVLDGSEGTQRVKIGEGFFVAGQGGTSARQKSFSFKQNMATNVPTAKSNVDISRIKLTATSNYMSKEAVIKINQDASNGFDNYDAYMKFGTSKRAVEPYFMIDNRAVVMNSISDLPYSAALNMSALQNNNVDLKFENIPSNVRVIFIDLSFGSIDTIAEKEVVNIDVVEGQNDNRFVILLEKVSNNIDTPAAADLNIWAYNNRLTINGEALTGLEVYNTLGQLVFSTKMSGNSYSQTLALNAGSYIAKATAKNGNKTIKFIINK